MREIKFRAWDGKKMHFAGEASKYFAIGNNSWGLYKSSSEDCVFGIDDSDECILMQYTGLKDKNGVEIYEGDIVRTLLHHAEVKSGWFKESVKDSETQNLYGWFIQDGDWQFNLNEHLEVVGNVYENPELIK